MWPYLQRSIHIDLEQGLAQRSPGAVSDRQVAPAPLRQLARCGHLSMLWRPAVHHQLLPCSNNFDWNKDGKHIGMVGG